jgi:hypothetical protein
MTRTGTANDASDFLAALDDAVTRERAALAALADKVDALVRLWNDAVALQATKPHPVDLADLRAAAQDELERAELQAVINRATKETR